MNLDRKHIKISKHCKQQQYIENIYIYFCMFSLPVKVRFSTKAAIIKT